MYAIHWEGHIASDEICLDLNNLLALHLPIIWYLLIIKTSLQEKDKLFLVWFQLLMKDVIFHNTIKLQTNENCEIVQVPGNWTTYSWIISESMKK